MSFKLTPGAQFDLVEIRDYYKRNGGPHVARKMLTEIRRGFEFLASMPGAGHTRADLTDEPVKFWSVNPFLIVYIPAISSPLWIVRGVHASQDLQSMFRSNSPLT